MSEVGIISKQYEQLVNTIDVFNAAVISLKKALLFESDKEKYKQLQIGQPEKNEAREILSTFVAYLMNLFYKRDEPDYRFIPEKVLERFRGNFNQEDDIKGQLKNIEKLLKGGKLLRREQFELLDRIVTILDMERNKLSKKLRSARG